MKRTNKTEEQTPVAEEQTTAESGGHILIKANAATAHGIDVLLEMLTFRRPHKTSMEKAFAEEFLVPLGVVHDSTTGNYTKSIGEAPTTLFSSHIDTVHAKEGTQKVVVDPIKHQIFKDDGFPLGADDATGVWLMMNMMAAGIKGHYVFHVGEEVGGLGSTAMVDSFSDWLKTFKRAIAFDRRGFRDVITHQRGCCCSDEFAEALSSELNKHAYMNYAPCDSGVFTDTANYTHLIPECTNLSVGYNNEHRSTETQCIKHALAMVEALIDVDWDSLPTKREAKKEVWTRKNTYANNYGGGYGGYGNHYDGFGVGGGAYGSKHNRLSETDILALVINKPLIAAQLLLDAKVTGWDVSDAEFELKYPVKKAAGNGTTNRKAATTTNRKANTTAGGKVTTTKVAAKSQLPNKDITGKDLTSHHIDSGKTVEELNSKDDDSKDVVNK